MNWQDILKSKYSVYDNIGLRSLYYNLRSGPWDKDTLEEMKAIMKELKRRGVKI